MATMSNIPVPLPMDCTGDVAGNWELFISSWSDYENATELSQKSFLVQMRKEYYNICSSNLLINETIFFL